MRMVRFRFSVMALTAFGSGGLAAVPPQPAPPGVADFLPDDDRPSPRYREIIAAAEPYLALIRERDGDGGRFMPAYVPDVQIEMKGSNAGRKQDKDCKNKTVKAIVNYVEAPTRISSYVGTLVDCTPTGMGLIRTSDGTVWVGQVGGYAEGKRPGLAIAAGDGLLKSGTRYRLGWMTGTPAQDYVATQQEAVSGMPTTVKRGAAAIWGGMNPKSIVDLRDGDTGPGQMVLRSGAEFDGTYDGRAFKTEASSVRYPERGIVITGARSFVSGVSGTMPLLNSRSLRVKLTKAIGGLPTGSYRPWLVKHRQAFVKPFKESSDGPTYLVSGAHIEKLIREHPEAFKPDISRDPSMLSRAAGNVRKCREVAFPAGYVPWWPGCTSSDHEDGEQVSAFSSNGNELQWSRHPKTGEELFFTVVRQEPTPVRSGSATVRVVNIAAKAFTSDARGNLEPVGPVYSSFEDAMRRPVQYRGPFSGGLPHGAGKCRQFDGPETACTFDNGVQTDPDYVERYAVWRAEEAVKLAEKAVQDAERQAEVERQRQQATEAAERRRIADENYRQRQEEQRRAERLAQMEEEADEPKRNYILEAIQDVGQKFQAAAVENQRGWDEVNRINRQTDDYNRRQREIVAQQQERNRQAAQERAAAASRSNAEISAQRRQAEQRLAEARARAAQLRNEAAARPASSASTKPAAPAAIGNEGQSMTAQTSSKSSGQPAVPAKSHPPVREASFLCLAHPTRGAGYYFCWGRQDNRRHLVGPSEVGGWKTPESLNRTVGCPNGSGPRSVNDGGVYWACGFGADGRYNRDAVAAAQADGHRIQLSLGAYYCSPGETACRRKTPTAP